MKILYRLRFIPLILSTLFFILSLLALIATFGTHAVISLPYQDPTPQMLQEQMEAVYWMDAVLPQIFLATVIGFCAIVLSSILLIYLRRKRGRNKGLIEDA